MKNETLIDKDAVYREYVDKVSAYVRQKIYNQQEAEDLVSTVFLKVFQNLDRFDLSKASISTWIYTITRNTVIDYYKTSKPQLEYMDEMTETASDEMLPEERFLQEEILEQLADALEQLPMRERDLIILHYYNSYTLKRIAEMMGMSYINAKVLHAKALKRLKSKLS